MKIGTRSQFGSLQRLLTPLPVAVMAFIIATTVLWATYPRPPRVVIEAGPDAVHAGFSPDGNWYLTVDRPVDASGVEVAAPSTALVRAWNSETGELGAAIERGKYAASQVGFMLDGRIFVGDRYYDAASGIQLPGQRFVGPDPGVVPIESSDGDSLLYVTSNVIVADAHSGEVRFQVPSGVAAAFNGDGKRLAVAIDKRHDASGVQTVTMRRTIELFDPQSGESVVSIVMPTEQDTESHVSRMALAPQAKKVAVAIAAGSTEAGAESPSSRIEVWDIASGSRERSVALDSEVVNALWDLQFLADGGVLMADAAGFGQYAWDLTVPPPGNVVPQGTVPSFLMVAPTGQVAAAWNDDTHSIQLWRLGAGRLEVVAKRRYADEFRANPLHFNAAGQLIVLSTRKNMASVRGMALRRSIVDWFPGLATTLLDNASGSFEVLDPRSGTVVGEVPARYDSTLASVALDGRSLVTPDLNRRFRDRFTIWNVPTATPWLAILGWSILPAVVLGTLVGVCHRVRRAAFSRVAVKPA